RSSIAMVSSRKKLGRIATSPTGAPGATAAAAQGARHDGPLHFSFPRASAIRGAPRGDGRHQDCRGPFPKGPKMDYLVRSTIAFVHDHQAWGVPIVFILAFCESFAFVSLVVPATGILL